MTDRMAMYSVFSVSSMDIMTAALSLLIIVSFISVIGFLNDLSLPDPTQNVRTYNSLRDMQTMDRTSSLSSSRLFGCSCCYCCIRSFPYYAYDKNVVCIDYCTSMLFQVIICLSLQSIHSINKNALCTFLFFVC